MIRAGALVVSLRCSAFAHPGVSLRPWHKACEPGGRQPRPTRDTVRPDKPDHAVRSDKATVHRGPRSMAAHARRRLLHYTSTRNRRGEAKAKHWYRI